MKHILFINGCIRAEQSRTLCLAKAFLEEFSSEQIEEVNLDRLNLMPLNSKTLAVRDRQIAEQDFSSADYDLAKQFKQTDLIVIAAPFWEGTFPAMVHTYLEHICVAGLTFELHRTGYKGLCKAKEAVFFTTRGGIYSVGSAREDEHAKGVLQTVFGTLGIETLTMIAAEGLDIRAFDVEKALCDAEQKARELAKDIVNREG